MANSHDLKYVFSGNSLSLFAEGRQIVLKGDDLNNALDLIRNDDVDSVYDKYFKSQNVLAKRITDDKVEVKDGYVFIDGKAIPGLLNTRLIQHLDNNLPIKPLVNFWRRLQNNPSYQAITRLFECLDVNHHPLVEDGRFLAWKRVDSNFKDQYTHKIDNSIGSKPTVPRQSVDEDMDKTCSYGLHVASFDYAATKYCAGDGRLVEVLVDPADVVAIPRDYNNQKMRVTSYEVIKECVDERKDKLVTIYGETILPSNKYNDSLSIKEFVDDEDDGYDEGYSYGSYDDEDEDDDDFDFDENDFDEDEDEDDEEYCDVCHGRCHMYT